MRPIRRGSNPIRLPSPIQTNNPALAQWVGEVNEAIRNLATRLPQANAPLLFGGGSSGYESVILPTKFFNDGTSEEPEWKVEFTSAKLWEHSMNDAGFPHDIKIADGYLTDDPKKSLEIAEGTNDVWLRFDIKADCEVELDTPELIIGEAPENTPFWPNRPGLDPDDLETKGSFGKTGTHIQRIGTITLEEGKRPTWKSESPHAVVWIGQTEWEDSTPDDGQSLYHKFEEGKDFLKTAKNADTEVEEGAEGVLNDEEEPFSEHLVFARICQKESDPQIHVTSEGDNESRKIIIKGNNFSTTISGRVKGLSVDDGLITGADEEPAEEGGWWGTAVWTFYSPGASSQENQVRFTYEAGRLILVEKEQSSGGFEEEEGAEGTPGSVQFWAENVLGP